ncbi:hypothetical protein B4N89_13600 [Embleya scabrispora]|uniref:Uncharacterized protein n=1 Tax=Embleya scabrispora TaxID=159449 RepID=A0A1T3NYB9_9ACTN|nr:hypothetical protein [Embleya scabrispora]OPC81833.1 hypothetical protein B4N89_13600 [Embleya scabrispora]
MDLIPIVLAAVVAGLAAGWLAEVILRWLSGSALAAPPPITPPTVRLPLHAVDPRFDRCWLCAPTPDPGRYDGELCPACRLVLDVFPDRPIPYWPAEGDDHR